MSQQKIVPNIWCQGNAEEVAEFYRSAFPDASEIGRSHYPTAGLLDFQQPMAGRVLTIDLVIGDFRLTLINADSGFTPNPMLSFMLNFDPTFDDRASEHLDALWARLSEGGRVLMPLDAYPFSARYGWVQDRYGVSWQLIATDPAGEPRPFVIPSLMFANDNTNRAEEAVRFYTSLFDDARIGTLARHEQDTGAARAGSLMFGEFAIGEEWFTAMDSPAPHAFDFDPGVSLMIDASTQEEIDHFWSALSSVPEAEACGWCQDRFGVSWQVAPLTLNETLPPEAFAAMMSMKKIVLADLEGAAQQKTASGLALSPTGE